MTELRERMIRAMQLRNFSPTTQKNYLQCIAGLTRFHHRAPDRLSQQDVEDYLLHLMVDRGYRASSARTAVSALRFFYLGTLGRDPRQFVLPTLRRKRSTSGVLTHRDDLTPGEAIEVGA